ncbi:unnamed protein product [Sphagnum compactum]
MILSPIHVIKVLQFDSDRLSRRESYNSTRFESKRLVLLQAPSPRGASTEARATTCLPHSLRVRRPGRKAKFTLPSPHQWVQRQRSNIALRLAVEGDGPMYTNFDGTGVR